MAIMIATNFHGAYTVPGIVLGIWGITLFTTTPKGSEMPITLFKRDLKLLIGVFTNTTVSRFRAAVIKEINENFAIDLSGITY